MNKKFIWPIRVYYEDTDLGGVVYYANYLKFLERARTEWLRARHVEQDELLAEHGVVFVIVEAHIRYHLPARFNEVLDVGVEVSEASRAQIAFEQTIHRGESLLVGGMVRAACVDAENFRARRIPSDIVERLR